ncbi:MAG TPA: carboxymuconolactone decarboxylase family protein [Terriglobia bacterium]|nr:carboxymuconolactone decarboxylase family protein [Terriglobia bacterium]
MELTSADFKVHSLTTAPEGSVPALRRLEKAVGGIPNLAGAMAESPALIESFISIREILHSKSLFDPMERELLLLTNATENKCGYCQAIHATFAGKAGVPLETIEQVRCGQEPKDTRQRALVDFARKVLHNRGRVEQVDLESFFAVGYTQAHVLDVIACLTLSTMANYTNHVAHVTPDDFIKPQYRKIV